MFRLLSEKKSKLMGNYGFINTKIPLKNVRDCQKCNNFKVH